MVDGSFDLQIDGSLDFDGGVVKVLVTGGDGARMICDAPSGCFGTPFGGQIEIGEDFELAALVEAPEDGGTLTVHVNAITTLAAALAGFNAGGDPVDPADVLAANDQVAGLFGLESTDLWALPGIDITDAGTGEEPSADALRAAYINAGILESLLEDSGDSTLDQRLGALLSDFTQNGGHLIVNEGTDNPDTVSLEDIFDGAVSSVTASQRTGDNNDNASSSLEWGVLSISLAEADTRSQNYSERERLAISAESLSFSGIRGRSIPGSTLAISGSGIPWAISSETTWLQFDHTSGTGDSTLQVTPVLAPTRFGKYNGSFTIYDTDVPQQKVTVNVDLTVGDSLAVYAIEPFNFDAVEGSTNPLYRTVSLGGYFISWSATLDQPWLSITPGYGSTPKDVIFRADPVGLKPGIHTAYVTFSDLNFDQKATVRVDMRIQPRRINTGESGVSFSSFPGHSVLSRTIEVTENLGEPLAWTAASDAAWLSVTPSGQTGESMTLTADPAGLTPGQLYTAKVRLSADDPSVTNVEYINTSLWVGATDPQDRLELDASARFVAADPVRPYVYVVPASSPDVDIYNVFTGALVDVIENVSPINNVVAVSPDGARLYVTDGINNGIVPIDLETLAALPAFSGGNGGSMVVREVNGKELLFTAAKTVYDTDTGELVHTPSYDPYAYAIDVSRNGKTMCRIGMGLSPYPLDCYGLTYSFAGPGVLTVEHRGSAPHGMGSNAMDIALSNDGGRVYAASGAPYDFLGFDTTTMQKVRTLTANAYPQNIEIDPNGNIYGSNEVDVWAHSQSESLLDTFTMTSATDVLQPRQLVVSGDGSRLIAATKDGNLVIVTPN